MSVESVEFERDGGFEARNLDVDLVASISLFSYV